MFIIEKNLVLILLGTRYFRGGGGGGGGGVGGGGGGGGGGRNFLGLVIFGIL